MGFFRRAKKVYDEDLGEAQLYTQAQKLAKGILAIQARWAVWLNAQALRLGPVGTKLLLGVLGFGFGMYCLWLVLSAFR
ncbi:hypothetical protein EZ428_18265 [Pedobacter frigiditerrae]|uniref:Uncharacterized protein n=1 Tax=Pedobacter frigiditerrae TaxID=2530452 RepID=A0A4V2MI09_9SPHI|nr:hypothetical protein [Pedobacter frigiditerrae]TCC88586.1 hypothetical protein EZ428_18265 [Pedobacter frigiditerrae]